MEKGVCTAFWLYSIEQQLKAWESSEDKEGLGWVSLGGPGDPTRVSLGGLLTLTSDPSASQASHQQDPANILQQMSAALW